MARLKPETEYIHHLLSHLPGCWWKIHGGPFQIAGLPDLLGVWEGKFIGIEVKVGDNVPSRPQQTQLERINLNKGIAMVITQKGILTCITYLPERTLRGNFAPYGVWPTTTLSKVLFEDIFTSWPSPPSQQNKDSLDL